jgi:chromosome segregation ATPase
VDKADALTAEGVEKALSTLRREVSGVLATLPEKFEELLGNYNQVAEAVHVKEEELKELYDIEKSAETLAALIEAQSKRRREFGEEMAAEKEALESEIASTRAAWQDERTRHEEETKEYEATEKKRRQREREEFDYSFAREKQLAKDRFADEQEALEREIAKRRRELEEREQAIAEREGELASLRQRVEGIPAEIDKAVAAEVKATTQRLTAEAKAQEELLKKQMDGERNVLTTRIESLEKTIEEQEAQIQRLSNQLEKSHQQVQDIAVTAIEGSSARASAAEEHSRRMAQSPGKSRGEERE